MRPRDDTSESPAPAPIGADDALKLAIDCIKEGRPRDAGALLRRILEIVPGHAGALHYAGMLAFMTGHHEDGIRLVKESLAADSSVADWHSNLGIMLLQANHDAGGALESFRTAVALAPQHVNARSNLGVLLRLMGLNVDAEAEYRTALEIDPNHADTYHNLAILLDATGRVPEAVTAYCHVLTLKPEYNHARRHLAIAYCRIGQRENAERMCREWVRLEPDSDEARHTLAAVTGIDVPDRASDAYVTRTFDRFSATFEAKLKLLHYRAPELVVEAIADAGINPSTSLEVLDLGCGTGWCGPLLAPWARSLTGVDLSSGMLAAARQKGTYDELVHAELTAYLTSCHRQFDLIVAADTVIYFGDLAPVVSAALADLRPGGLLVFTLEELVEPEPGEMFRLEPHGRYSHRHEYVEALLAPYGLDVSVTHAALRNEGGQPVAGLVVRAISPRIGDGNAHE
jgi:predicted TPR repeat methyltransferase